MKILSASPRNTGRDDGPLSIYEYSYSDFSHVDPRIKLYLWDKFIPTVEDICAFVRADMIMKDITSDVTFPGFFVFSSNTMYIMKITKEERGDPNAWLEKYENVNLDMVKCIEGVYCNQAVSIEYVSQPSNRRRFKYLLLLHDHQRTANFLSFMKKSEIFPSNTIADLKKDNVPILPQLDESIRYFIMSELIIIYKNNEEWKKHSLVGFAFTESLLLILKNEVDWLDYETSEKHDNDLTIEHEMKLVDLVSAEDKRTALVLQFVDERNDIEYYWHIKTGLGLNDYAVSQLNALWSPHYKLNLPVTRNRNAN